MTNTFFDTIHGKKHSPSPLAGAGFKRIAGIAAFCVFAVFAHTLAAHAAGKDETVSTQTLYSLSSQADTAVAAAAGYWQYDLVSEDAVLGRLSMDLAVEDCPAGKCYVLTQEGRFELSATDTRTVQSRAVLKQDLTLVQYHKEEVAAIEGAEPVKATMDVTVGGLTVTAVQSAGGPPQEITLRKTGPVFLTPAATWLLIRTLNPEKNTRYTFDAYIPDSSTLVPGYIETTGPVLSKTETDTKTVFRVKASNGETVLDFDINDQGDIIRYGPETGEIEFLLVD